MANVKQIENGLVLNCDCGAEYTITKDESGKLVLKGKHKKVDPPETPPKPKPKDFFDSLFGEE